MVVPPPDAPSLRRCGSGFAGSRPATVGPMSTSAPGAGPTEPTGDGPYGQSPYAGQPAQPDPYGHDPYGQGAHGQQPAPAPPRNGLGLAALIVGIVSLLVALIPLVGILGGLGGVVAIILGVLALVRVRRGVATNRGVSITGVVLGGLAVLAAVAWLVVIFAFAGSNTFQGIAACQSVPTAQQQQCVSDALGQP